MKAGWPMLEAFGERVDTAALEAYVAELIKWNKAIRLVGPSDAVGISLQVVDSLLPFIHAPPTFPLLDIGSGAGLPAIPLAVLWRGEKVVCIEPRSKRVSFIRHAARTLGLDKVEAHCARAEELLGDNSLVGGFRTVTARAVADIRTLLALSKPFLAKDGRVILGRGGEAPEEVEGWLLEKHVRYAAPEGMAERSVVVYAVK